MCVCAGGEGSVECLPVCLGSCVSQDDGDGNVGGGGGRGSFHPHTYPARPFLLSTSPHLPLHTTAPCHFTPATTQRHRSLSPTPRIEISILLHTCSTTPVPPHLPTGTLHGRSRPHCCLSEYLHSERGCGSDRPPSPRYTHLSLSLCTLATCARVGLYVTMIMSVYLY